MGKLTSDFKILQTISGLSIEIAEEKLEPRQHICSQKQQIIIDNEVKKLFEENVITRCEHEKGEIISPIFLRDKPDGSFRLILNLKNINKNLEKQHFKMETIISILKLVTPNMFFTKIDLKDAYYTIPTLEEHQKYLKFANKGYLNKFTCLPNGYCHGPRKFTKALKPPLSELRLGKITIAAYLDDCINMHKAKLQCWENTKTVIKTFQNLGFTVHPEPKSSFYPTQKIEFLGFVIGSVSMTITLTDTKKEKLKLFCSNILNTQMPKIRTIASILGKITSSFPAAKFGRLHYRGLERCKTAALNENIMETLM